VSLSLIQSKDEKRVVYLVLLAARTRGRGEREKTQPPVLRAPRVEFVWSWAREKQTLNSKPSRLCLLALGLEYGPGEREILSKLARHSL
jgi:hypothetical protein